MSQDPAEQLAQASAEAINRVVAATSRPGLYDLWLMPIRKPLAVAAETAEKPIGEMTVPDLMAWAYVLGYGGLTGYVLGKVIGNLLVVALGGTGRR